MRNNKIISIALAMGLAVTFTSCGSKDSSSSVSDSASSSYTTEELAGKISLCGKQLKYPLTLADLGDGFTFDSYKQQSSNGTMVNLLYDNQLVCALEYYCGQEEVNENTPIDNIQFTANDFNRDKISIDGFTANDTPEVLEEKLGAPTSTKKGIRTYDTSNNGKLEVVDIGGKIFSVAFFMKLPENNK